MPKNMPSDIKAKKCTGAEKHPMHFYSMPIRSKEQKYLAQNKLEKKYKIKAQELKYIKHFTAEPSLKAHKCACLHM